MSEKPILFLTPMVKAILEGRKTQTRRIFDAGMPSHEIIAIDETYFLGTKLFRVHYGAGLKALKCPYGKVGDSLWVRETFYAFGYWIENSKGRREFVDRTDRDTSGYGYSTNDVNHSELYSYKDRFSPVIGWWKRPSIFMPRDASRINLEITNIRVERLQDISEEDAKAEGLQEYENRYGGTLHKPIIENGYHVSAKHWNKINEKRGFSWESNPWVWVIEFKKAEQSK